LALSGIQILKSFFAGQGGGTGSTATGFKAYGQQLRHPEFERVFPGEDNPSKHRANVRKFQNPHS
jgi:hypothetical protein